MRLHTPSNVVFAATALAATFAFGISAQADTTLDQTKPSDSVASAKPRKMYAEFAPHAQLFVEQKEAPGLSKTALRTDSSLRFSQKLKD